MLLLDQAQALAVLARQPALLYDFTVESLMGRVESLAATLGKTQVGSVNVHIHWHAAGSLHQSVCMPFLMCMCTYIRMYAKGALVSCQTCCCCCVSALGYLTLALPQDEHAAVSCAPSPSTHRLKHGT